MGVIWDELSFYASIRQRITAGCLKVCSWDRRTYAFCSHQLLPGILQFPCCVAANLRSRPKISGRGNLGRQQWMKTERS